MPIAQQTETERPPVLWCTKCELIAETLIVDGKSVYRTSSPLADHTLHSESIVAIPGNTFLYQMRRFIKELRLMGRL